MSLSLQDVDEALRECTWQRPAFDSWETGKAIWARLKRDDKGWVWVWAIGVCHLASSCRTSGASEHWSAETSYLEQSGPPTLCSVRWTPEVLGCLVGASITSPDLSCSVCVSPFFPPSLPLVRVAGTKLQAVTAKATPFAFCPWDWICLKKQRNYCKVCVLIRVSTATTKHHD